MAASIFKKEKSEIRLIIAGDRKFSNLDILDETMIQFVEEYGMPDIVISGRAAGADTLGEEWAEDHEVEIEYHPALWDKYGSAAGPIRNAQMAESGTHLVAFMGEWSRGTRSMVALADAAELESMVITITDKDMDI